MQNQKYRDIHEDRTQIDEPVLEVFPYGSVVYGTKNEHSDEDYIVIVDSDKDLYYSVNNEFGNTTVYSESVFIRRIQEHHITAMECIFLSETNKYRQYFELDLEKLRREISAVASNSFVKCKKKMAIGEDYIGKKSMFHSIRILMFGIQIARYGRIISYSCGNFILPIIMNMETWEEIKAFCQPIANTLKTDFKILAPLESDKDA